MKYESAIAYCSNKQYLLFLSNFKHMQTGDVNVTLLNASPELMCFFRGPCLKFSYFSSSSSLHVTKFLFLGSVTTVQARLTQCTLQISRQSWYDFAGNVHEEKILSKAVLFSLSKSLSNIPGVVNIRNVFKIIQKSSGA